MKSLFKYLAALSLGLVAFNFAFVGILVLGSLAGVESGIWLFWYLTLFSTTATLIVAASATIVFLVESGRERYQSMVPSMKASGFHHHAPTH